MENKETLEEASIRAVESRLFKDETLFIAGVKWQQKQIQNLRDELYNQLPTGEVNAFDLIKIINSHIQKLDELKN